MLTLVLLVLAVLAVGALVDLVSPTRACARCSGERVAKSRWDGRIIACPRCHATGRHARRGARLVHRGWHAAAAARSELTRSDQTPEEE